MNVSEIRRVTVGCANLDASLAFWRDLVGFSEVWRGETEGGGTGTAWGIPEGTRVRAALLRYDGIATGQIRLIECTPHAEVHVRTRRDDPWAVGVGALDVNVRDAEKTFRMLRDAGFESEASQPHYYNIGGLEQSEVVFRTPDHVNLVLIGAKDYPKGMARENVAGDFSALTVVSQFVPDVDESATFYRDGLGLEQGFDAWVDDVARPLINEMVGIPAHAHLRLCIYRAHDEPDGKTLLLQTRGVPVRDITARMQPTSLGIVMLGHAASDLEALRSRLGNCGGSVQTGIGAVALGPAVERCFLARTPAGILLEFYEA